MVAATVTKDRGNTVKADTRQTCQHHWQIEDVAGRASTGVCNLCGAHKKFMNYLPDCLQMGEEEYEAWLSKQKDYVKASDIKKAAAEKVTSQPER